MIQQYRDIVARGYSCSCSIISAQQAAGVFPKEIKAIIQAGKAAFASGVERLAQSDRTFAIATTSGTSTRTC